MSVVTRRRVFGRYKSTNTYSKRHINFDIACQFRHIVIIGKRRLTMPKKLKVDGKKLLKMVKDGVPQNEIMSRLGFKTSTQLKTAITNAAMDEKILPRLVGGRRGGKEVAVKKNVKVNSRGSLIIPKQIIDAYGLKVGDSFNVRKSKAGLSLKKV